MAIELLIYRIFRLRRLALAAVLPTLAYLAYLWPHVGGAHGYLFATIALLPLLHLVVYPSAWTETFAVTGAALFMLWLGSMIDPAMSLEFRVVRYGLLALAGSLFFLVLVGLFPSFLFLGPERSYDLRARMASRLPMAELKAAITYYPGREDEFVTCGAAGADGVFPVELQMQEIDALPETTFDFGPDVVTEFADSGAVQPDYDLLCKIDRDRADGVDLVFFTPHEREPSVASYRFREVKGGTIVDYAESGTALTPLLRLGMFLQDFMGDFLQSQIELAEGRTRLANRSFPVRQLIVDVARLFPVMDGPT